MSQVRTGAVPPLADGYVARPELERALIDALFPGATAALVPAGAGGRGWREACRKAQLAITYAESPGTSAGADILVWVTATSRAAVLSTFAEAAVTVSAADPGEPAEARAAGLLHSVRDTTAPWLIVLDDLTSPAVMEGLMGRLTADLDRWQGATGSHRIRQGAGRDPDPSECLPSCRAPDRRSALAGRHRAAVRAEPAGVRPAHGGRQAARR